MPLRIVKKRDFPAFGRLSAKFDLDVLKNAYQQMQSQEVPELFKSSLEARRDIAQHFPIETGGYQYIPINSPESESLAMSGFAGLSKLDRARLLLGPEIKMPVFDERSYTRFLPNVSASFIEEVSKIRGKLARARFVKLRAGAEIKAHIDNPLHISIRIHIPLVTNPDVTFFVLRDGDWESAHFPADGSAYFLNTAYTHKVMNSGTTDRVHLILNLASFEDIEHLRLRGF